MANYNNNSFNTRAGLRPSEKELPFQISTSDVTNYLSQRLDALTKTMATPVDIELSVASVEAGSKFVPFTVVLSPNAIVSKKYNTSNEDEPSIFRPNDNDGAVRLLEPVAKLLAVYSYDKCDGEAFFSADWRRARGVSTNGSAILKKNRTPRLMKFKTNKGTFDRVIFLIDPIRVFHDMLVMDDNPSNFHVEIVNWNKIRQGEYRYDVLRVLNKKNKNRNNQNFIDALTHQYGRK